MNPIAQYLNDLDVSRSELARVVGVSRVTMSKWASGRYPSAWRLLRWLSLATGVSSDVYLGLRQCACGRTVRVEEIRTHCEEAKREGSREEEL